MALMSLMIHSNVCLCWLATKLHELLQCKDAVQDIRPLMLGCMKGRSAQNWALLLRCAKQVKIQSFFIYIFTDLNFCFKLVAH